MTKKKKKETNKENEEKTPYGHWKRKKRDCEIKAKERKETEC